MSRKLNIFILFLITIVCMLFPENIKNNPILVIKREECNGMMNSLDCDVLIEKKTGDEGLSRRACQENCVNGYVRISRLEPVCQIVWLA